MLNFTIEEQRALETSALEAAVAMDIANPEPTGDWEPALWTDALTVLVNTRQSVAAIVHDPSGWKIVELLGNDQMSFLVDQIHRCQAGALNGYRPAKSVTV